MLYLLLTSLIWAFSFGLVKGHLGNVDAGFVAFSRLALALLLFLPLWRLRAARPSVSLRLFGIGMVQFGLMYVFYIESFRFLDAHQVALLTIFTPLYVASIDDGLEKRFRPRNFWAALLAVAGTAVIVYSEEGGSRLLSGILLVQASNACFAVGQVLYRRLPRADVKWRDRDIFAWLYLGGSVAAGVAMLLSPTPLDLGLGRLQILVLLYLGLLASGVGFFLWNIGALRVSSGVLAIFNNVKIPLAVIVSLLFFRERAHPFRLSIGSAVILVALYLSTNPSERERTKRVRGE